MEASLDSMPNIDANPVGEVTKIGNYSIPAFAAFVTLALSFTDGDVAVLFGVYTVATTIVAYAHRLAWLRRRDKKPRDLPWWQLVLIFAAYVFLLAVLVKLLCNQGYI